MKILGKVNLAAPIRVECIEALAQLLLAGIALLATAHKIGELDEVELLIVIKVCLVTLCCIVPHSCIKVLIASSGHIVLLGSRRKGAGAAPIRPRRQAPREGALRQLRCP